MGFWKSLGIFLLIVLILGGLASAGYYFYKKYGKGIFSEEEPEEEAEKLSSISMRAYDGDDFVTADYFLYKNKRVVSNGTLHSKSFEKYSKAKEDAEYTLSASGKYHYFNYTNCTGKKVCIVSLPKIADVKLDYAEDEGKYVIKVRVTDGIINNPIICTSWTENILKAEFESLGKTEIPKRYKNKIDYCFNIGESLDSTKEFNLLVAKFQETEDDKVYVYLIDNGFFPSENSFKEAYSRDDDDIGLKDKILEIPIR